MFQRKNSISRNVSSGRLSGWLFVGFFCSVEVPVSAAETAKGFFCPSWGLFCPTASVQGGSLAGWGFSARRQKGSGIFALAYIEITTSDLLSVIMYMPPEKEF